MGECSWASCVNLVCRWRLKSLPEPVLERPKTDQHRIRWRENAVIRAVPSAVPRELSRLDEHQARGQAAARGVVDDGVGREPGDVGKRRRMQRQR